jgi:Got1/Sft2-like family
MANTSIKVSDFSLIPETSVNNTTRLVEGDAPQEYKKAGTLRSVLHRVKSSVVPMSFIKSAALKTSRLKNFFILSCFAFVLFVLALSSLPMILIFPEKFALFFSLGSLVMHLALSNLKPSTEEYLKALVSNNEYSTICTMYFVSLFMTLYSAIYLGSYVIVIAACGLQMFSLGWLLFTMFPRGTQGALTVLKYTLKICPGKSLIPI